MRMAFVGTAIVGIGSVGVVSGSLPPKVEGCEVARGNQRLYSKKRFSPAHSTNLHVLHVLLQYRISIYSKFTHVSIPLNTSLQGTSYLYLVLSHQGT